MITGIPVGRTPTITVGLTRKKLATWLIGTKGRILPEASLTSITNELPSRGSASVPRVRLVV